MLCTSIVLLSGCGNKGLEVTDTVNLAKENKKVTEIIEKQSLEEEQSLDDEAEKALLDVSKGDHCDDLIDEEETITEADIVIKAEVTTEKVVREEPELTTKTENILESETVKETTEAGPGAEIYSEDVTEELSISETACYVDEYADQVLILINEQRQAAGVTPLSMNTTLISAAKLRAKELTQKFSHTRPDGSICFSAFNVPYSGAAENIAAGQWSPEWVVNSWMNSEEHRTNILDARFTQVAIACIYDPNSPYEYYWVQLFMG